MELQLDNGEYQVVFKDSNLSVEVTESAPLNVVIGESARIEVGEAINYIKAGQAEIEEAVQEGISDFDANATSKTNDFNSNATDKTTAFNNNASDKTTAFNNNATAKTGDFDTNATNKTNDFNSNYTEKKGLIDAEVLVAQGAAGEAKQWAIGDPSEPTGNSAKYWAEQAESELTGLTSRVSIIEGEIPSAASSSNQLADKNYVLSVLPTVNNATLTIQKNGTSVATFTANQSENTTANIVVPTKTSDLDNDTGYITGITSSDVTTALGYTPYNSTNPNGYTSNVGTVTSVNNTSPDGSGNVSITVGDTLPSQSGQSGKFLTTDGTSTSWGTPTASVASDNKSITKNSSNEIQTVGVIDQNNTSSAIKTWTGTRAQYEAIVTKDATTLYTITDDTDVKLSVIEALYPVGSIYITTANSCPLANIISGSTWVLVSAGMVLQGADGNHAAGTTISAGLPNITGSVLFDSNSSNQFIPTDAFNGCLYGTVTATKSNYLSTATTGGSNKERARQLNVDASRSNSIYGGSNTVQPPAFAVNIYRRTA